MDVLNLMAKITLDSSEYDKGLDDASNKASSFGTKLKKGVSVAGKAVVAGIGVASTAVAGLVGTAVKSFGDYEQLVGGINTLYKDASDEMLAYANNAYKTAGLSANEYMQTAIDSSAAMIASLDGDTKQAAKLTDMAITDMADNANKMGTSMESLQNAYKGFSRGNFQMLDNLALGFAGTKEGMQELLDKAEELSGVHYDISSYADIVQAIHVIQKEMGIMDATRDEAMTTLQGSFNMTKSAWENLVTGIANPDADIGQLIDNFVDSLSALGENIIPIVEKALEGVGKLVSELVPIIVERLPGLIDELLPPLLDASISLVSKIIQNLPQILEALLNAVLEALGMLSEKLPEIIPQLVDGLTGIVSVLVEKAPEVFNDLVDAVLDVLDGIGEGLAEKIPALSLIFENLELVVGGVVTALIAFKGAMAITSLINGVQKAITTFKASMTALNVATKLQTIAQKALNLVMSVNPFVLIVTAIGALIGILITLWKTSDGFRDAVTSAWENIKEAFTTLWDALSMMISDLIEWFKNAWESISTAWSGVVDFFSGIWDGIVGVFEGVADWFTELFSNAWDGITGIWNTVTDWFSGVWDGIKGVFEGVGTWFTEKFQSAWDGITGIFDKLGGFFSGVWDSVTGIFKDAGVAVGDAISGAVKGAVNAVLNGATGIINGFISAINGAISIINKIPGVSISKISKLEAPQLEKGGILERGQVGILEGNGAEAVVPLERNSKWIRAVAKDMQGEFNLAGAGGDIIIPVYIGTDRLDEMVVKANQIHSFRSGGVGNV